MDINANQLHEFIEFLKKEETVNEFGEVEFVYQPYKKVKARVQYRTTREKEINSQLTALRVIKFKIRFRRDVDETMVIRFWGDLYDIRAIEHVGRKATFVMAERGKLQDEAGS